MGLVCPLVLTPLYILSLCRTQWPMCSPIYSPLGTFTAEHQSPKAQASVCAGSRFKFTARVGFHSSVRASSLKCLNTGLFSSCCQPPAPSKQAPGYLASYLVHRGNKTAPASPCHRVSQSCTSTAYSGFPQPLRVNCPSSYQRPLCPGSHLPYPKNISPGGPGSTAANRTPDLHA